MMGVDTEIEGLRAAVSRHFSVTQIVVNPFAIAFRVAVDPGTMDAAFDALRRDLIPRNYIPSITREQGVYTVNVQKRPEPKFRGTQVNLLLLIATIGTTWVAGAWNWQAYAGVPLVSLDAVLYGFVSFTVPLLAILGAHEMGHYLVAKRHGVRASLPFFIPSIPPLGTFGAFISMRDPIPNRKALLEIGIAGPLVGFCLAVPIALIGLALGAADARPAIVNGGGEIFSPSVLYGWMQSLFPQALADPFRRHPTAFAGWVGLFVTAINLLPAGQLDGGHVARALFGEQHRYLSWSAVLFLLVLGFFSYSWFLFALIILLLGVRHPPPLNDLTKLRPSRQVLGAIAIAILVLTFVPTPFVTVPANAGFAFEMTAAPHGPIGSVNVTISAPGQDTFAVNVNNTGNVDITVHLEIRPQNLDRIGWTLRIVNFTVYGGSSPQNVTVGGPSTFVSLNVTQYATVRILVMIPSGQTPGVFTFSVRGGVSGPGTPNPIFEDDLDVNVTVA